MAPSRLAADAYLRAAGIREREERQGPQSTVEFE
jgi:hypothetical protein